MFKQIQEFFNTKQNLFNNVKDGFNKESKIKKNEKKKLDKNFDLSEIVNIEAQFNNQNLFNKKQEEFKEIMFSLKVRDFEENSNRLGLDLLLILDISGSMHGDRLNYWKETCYFIIDELESCDRLSIICYDNKVDYICNFVSLDSNNKEKLKNIILKLNTRGSTNIKLAINEGFNVIKNRNFKNDVTSIFLLTDGQDTCGNNKPDIIKKYETLDKANKKENIIFNTFGFGSYHDSELLTALSKNNGSYFFIKDVDTIADCFVECLGPMISILCKNSKIKIKFNENIKVEKTFNKNFNKNIININTIGEGMKRYYFCRIKIPKLDSNIKELFICDLELECDSEFSENGKFNKKHTFTVNIVDNENEVGLENKDFSNEYCKIEMSEKLDNYYKELKNGNGEIAKKKLKSECKLMKEKYIDNKFLNVMENNLNECDMEFNDMLVVNEQINCLKNQNNFVSKKMKSYNSINVKTRGLKCKLKK